MSFPAALCPGVAGSYPAQAQRANGTEISAAGTRSHCVCTPHLRFGAPRPYAILPVVTLKAQNYRTLKYSLTPQAATVVVFADLRKAALGHRFA